MFEKIWFFSAKFGAEKVFLSFQGWGFGMDPEYWTWTKLCHKSISFIVKSYELETSWSNHSFLLGICNEGGKYCLQNPQSESTFCGQSSIAITWPNGWLYSVVCLKKYTFASRMLIQVCEMQWKISRILKREKKL